MEEAVAFFYDNEYDSELSIRSATGKRTLSNPKLHMSNQCSRNLNSRASAYVVKLGNTKKLEHKCTAYITITENSLRSEGKKGGWQFN